jgi:general secretion pathway protein I
MTAMQSNAGQERGFTLIEVMLSMAVVAIALVALLGLQHQTLQSIIRANQLSTAAALAQEVMTEAELQGFPPLGDTSGNFETTHPGKYHNFRWERDVERSAVFPDIRTVHVRIYFGNHFGRRFDVTELIRNPLPMQGL